MPAFLSTDTAVINLLWHLLRSERRSRRVKKVNRLNLSASRTVDRIMMFKMATVEMAELDRAGDPITKFWAIVSETLSPKCATASPVNYMISKQIAPQFPLLKTVYNAPKLT